MVLPDPGIYEIRALSADTHPVDRVLLVGGAMLLVGLALAGVFVIVSRYGATFETFEDTVTGWLDRL